MIIPNTYTEINETGCCAIPNVDEWDEREITFEDKQFIRMYTRSFLYVPLNMSAVMTAIQAVAAEADVEMAPEQVMTLSHDISPWKAERLYAVRQPVKGADNVLLSGTLMTKVFDGPFRDAKKWYDALAKFVTSKGKTLETTYFFYTTCPKCAKHYGKNYTIGLAKVR